MSGRLALLVVDMQNGFLHRDGSLASRGRVIPDADQLLRRTANLVSEARALGAPVLYTRHQFRPDLLDAPRSLLARYPAGSLPLVAGTWDAAVVDRLAPAPGDVVVDKNRYDAFLRTDMESILRGLGVGALLVAGVVTNMCVESTVRSAEQRDFEVSVASDCVRAYDPELHRASLASMAAGFAVVEPSQAALGRLRRHTPAQLRRGGPR